MVIDNKGKLPLHLVGQSASQKNRGKSEDIKKLLKNKMPADDDQGEIWPAGIHSKVPVCQPAKIRMLERGGIFSLCHNLLTKG